MRRSPIIFAIFLFSIVLLAACTPTDDFSAGQPLTRDELASLSSEIFTEAEGPETVGGFSTQVVVYWTEGGDVYHLDRNCYHLKRAEAVESGSVKHAWERGKERVCSVCGRK